MVKDLINVTEQEIEESSGKILNGPYITDMCDDYSKKIYDISKNNRKEDKIVLLQSYYPTETYINECKKRFNEYFGIEDSYAKLKDVSLKFYASFIENVAPKLKNNLFAISEVSIDYANIIENLNNVNIAQLTEEEFIKFNYVAAMYKLVGDLVCTTYFNLLDAKKENGTLSQQELKIYNYYNGIVKFFIEEIKPFILEQKTNIEETKLKRLK